LTADLIVTNARVATMDGARSTHEAVAVTGGRITAVGDAREIGELRGPATRVIDAEGGMVLPGFQDAHCHLGESGYQMSLCDLSESGGADAHPAAIAAYAAAHSDRPVVAGGGWAMSDYPGGVPTREALDAIVSDRPALLYSRDYHSAWVNTAALEAAGITRDTPDPAGGRIEHDADGNPAGTLQESAIALAASLIPEPDAEERVAGLLAAQRYYHSLGITACQDALVRQDWQETYERLAASGELVLRVRANLDWDAERDESQLAELVERRRSGRVGRLDCGSVKFFSDGVVESRTANMLEPYLDEQGRSTGEDGVEQYAPADLIRFVGLCDAEGFDVHIHTIGDRAVRESLDAFAFAVATNGSRDARHQLAHVEFVHDDDLPRLRTLGVISNVTPLWAHRDPYITDMTIPIVTERAARTIYRFGDIVRSGAPLVFGSDWSVSTPDPLYQLAVAVGRFLPGGDPEPLDPTQSLDLTTAIACQTIAAAHAARLERETGSIEPGKLADLVVLDRDLYELEPAGYPDARVLMTISEGAVVHAADGWA
jgi:predicted amidohydrolase YtcJ